MYVVKHSINIQLHRCCLVQGYTNCKLSPQKRKPKGQFLRDTHGDTSQTLHRSGCNYMDSIVKKIHKKCFNVWIICCNVTTDICMIVISSSDALMDCYYLHGLIIGYFQCQLQHFVIVTTGH